MNMGKAIVCVSRELWVYNRMEVVDYTCDEGENVSGNFYIVELEAVEAVTSFPKAADVGMKRDFSQSPSPGILRLRDPRARSSSPNAPFCH